MHPSRKAVGAAACLALNIPRLLIWFFSHETHCNVQEGVVRGPPGPLGAKFLPTCTLLRLPVYTSDSSCFTLASVYGIWPPCVYWLVELSIWKTFQK